MKAFKSYLKHFVVLQFAMGLFTLAMALLVLEQGAKPSEYAMTFQYLHVIVSPLAAACTWFVLNRTHYIEDWLEGIDKLYDNMSK